MCYVILGATEAKSIMVDEGAGGKDVYMCRNDFRRWEGKKDASEIGGTGRGSCIHSPEVEPGGPAPKLRTFGSLLMTR
jgi:hypothetical protein